MIADIDVVLTRIKQTAVIDNTDSLHSCKDSSILIVPSLQPVESLGRSALRHYGMDIKTTILRLNELYEAPESMNEDSILWICNIVITQGNDVPAVQCLAADILRRSCDTKLLGRHKERKKWKVVSACFLKKERSAQERVEENDSAREQEQEFERSLESKVVIHSRLVHTTKMISALRDICDKAIDSVELLLTLWYLVQAIAPSIVLVTDTNVEDTRLKPLKVKPRNDQPAAETSADGSQLSILKRYKLLKERRQLEEPTDIKNTISTAEIETTHEFRLYAIETALRLATDAIKNKASKAEVLLSEAVLTIGCIIKGIKVSDSVDEGNRKAFERTVVESILENNTITYLIGLLQKRQPFLLRRVLGSLESLALLDEKLAVTLMNEARATLPLTGTLHAVRFHADLVAAVWRIFSIISAPEDSIPTDLRNHGVIQVFVIYSFLLFETTLLLSFLAKVKGSRYPLHVTLSLL
eukprot:TRINITY_DN4124_c0_g2_i1.p1 TRINITY_DN4124_c0_g2~~TRINITY_DN4124_c0_g2_i1.p1  ORF type:complete len:483 (+),score=93.85 TRINITY_DN4124_c0_g2_i1:41-1450(+)